MGSKTARVSARVPEELVEELEKVMKNEGIDSISQCLRYCIEEYIKLKSLSLHTGRISLDVGEDLLEDIDNLVVIGRVSDRDEAFKSAIKSWTESQVDKYYLNRARYSKTIKQVQETLLEARAERKLSTFHQGP